MNNTFRTKDLAEASFLVASNIELSDIEKTGRVCWFIFKNKSECEMLVKKFWFGNASIPARSYYESIQALKNQIFA